MNWPENVKPPLVPLNWPLLILLEPNVVVVNSMLQPRLVEPSVVNVKVVHLVPPKVTSKDIGWLRLVLPVQCPSCGVNPGDVICTVPWVALTP